MFGLNEITWPEFLRFIVLSLFAWYALILFWAWFKTNGNRHKNSFEDFHTEKGQNEILYPINVSSGSLPSEILPVNPVENVHLEVSQYEETAYADGLNIKHYGEENIPVLARMLSEIQYHH